MSRVLAQAFVQAGHEVKLVTQTGSAESDGFPFEVIRRPGARRLLGLVRWCDVYYHNNVSLITAWPLLILRRPWVVTHQTWLSADWKGRLKRMLLRQATGVSISRAIADEYDPSEIIPNPYDATVFYERLGIRRERDLIFVGRLIRDKGAHILVEALARLRLGKQHLTLTIVGSGPEEPVLAEEAQRLGVRDQVRFAGMRRGTDLAELINTHRVMVIPSLWLEPFGVVALEGIACGCVVVASEGGGLKDAVGPCGVTFPNGDVEALAERLAELFEHPEGWSAYRTNAAAHLARHTGAAISAAYLRLLERCARDARRVARGID